MVDELYMRRCLELAEIGLDNVSPNPMVGCVIVADGKIIGEGYHRQYGTAHAEVNAINDVFQKHGDLGHELLKKATVYVSLEPCAHFGKTPPCADLLVKHQVKEVIIGNTDPFPAVNGQGIEKLRMAGIKVSHGMLAAEGRALNKRFFTRVEKQRPYIILKWAQTANGYFTPLINQKKWISNALSKKLVHKWRAEEDAILVGKKTVMTDNPELNTREWPGSNPVRIVIDKQLEIPETSHVYNDQVKTIFLNEVKTDVISNNHFVQMEDMTFYLPQKIAFQLYLMDIQSVIIEGGANILNQFISAGLWDEARIIKSSTNWQEGVTAPQINGFLEDIITLDTDTLFIHQNRS